MDYNNMRVAELKALTREHGLRGCSQLRKAELIELLQNNQPRTRPAGSHMQRPYPIPAPRSIPALRPPRTRPPRPTKGLGPPLRGGLPHFHHLQCKSQGSPQVEVQSIRFRPNHPRQLKLMRKLEKIP